MERDLQLKPGEQLGTWLIAIGLIPVLAYFVMGGGASALYSASGRIVAMVVATAIIVAWLIVAIQRPSWRPRSLLIGPIALALIALATSAIVSGNWAVSGQTVTYAVVAAFGYLLLVQLLRRPTFARRLDVALVFLLVAVCVAYLAIVTMDWLDWFATVGGLLVPPLRPRLEGLAYENPSGVVAMATLLFAATLPTVWSMRRWRRLAACSLTILVSSVIVIAGSRAGWLAVALGGATGVLAFYVSRPTSNRVNLSRRILSVAVITALVVAVALGPAILSRVNAGGEDLRAGFYELTARMWANSPITGLGPGTWASQRIQFTHWPETDFYVPHAHNVYLQTIAEVGLVGLIAGVILVVAIIRLVWSSIRGAQAARRWAIAASFAISYLAVHQFLDSFMNMPAILMVAAYPIARLDGMAPDVKSAVGQVAASRPVLALFVVAITVAGGASLQRERTILEYETRLANLNAGLETASAELIDAASRVGLPASEFTEGWAQARLGQLSPALGSYRNASIDDLPVTWLNIAGLEFKAGDRQEALEALAKALRVGRQQAAVALSAGSMYEQLGRADLALDAYADAIAASPALAADPYFKNHVPTEDGFRRLIDEGIRRAAPERAWEVAIAAGRYDQARGLAPTGYERLVDAVAGVFAGDLGRVPEVLSLTRSRPHDLVILSWAARVSSIAGRPEDAERFRHWAELIQTRGSNSAWELAVVSDLIPVDRQATVRSVFHGHYAYRVPMPFDQLDPQFPRILKH